MLTVFSGFVSGEKIGALFLREKNRKIYPVVFFCLKPVRWLFCVYMKEDDHVL